MKLYRVYCINCRTHLYNYTGDFHGKPSPKQFVPARDGIVPPRKGEPLVCPVCGQRWHMLRENGSIVVLTDVGLRPNAPTGPRHIFTYPKEAFSRLEAFMADERAEYIEETPYDQNKGRTTREKDRSALNRIDGSGTN